VRRARAKRRGELRRLRQEARDLLARYHYLVTAVAGELLEKGVLTGPAIDAVIRDAERERRMDADWRNRYGGFRDVLGAVHSGSLATIPILLNQQPEAGTWQPVGDASEE
jgi:hypothetical protein